MKDESSAATDQLTLLIAEMKLEVEKMKIIASAKSDKENKTPKNN